MAKLGDMLVGDDSDLILPTVPGGSGLLLPMADTCPHQHTNAVSDVTTPWLWQAEEHTSPGGATASALPVEGELPVPGKRRWEALLQGGIHQYIADNPDAFRRRVSRGIPAAHRWTVWKAAVRLDEHVRPGLYHQLLLSQNEWTRAIEIDISRTFPDVAAFDKEQEQRLLRVLHAYASFNPDVGYCQGMNFVAGLLLLVSHSEEETFWMFVRLMEDGKLNGFYKTRFPLLRRYLEAFDQLLGKFLPDLREHFLCENVQHAVYLHQWFLTLFINCLPLPMVLAFWDLIVCQGLECVLPITVALLQVLSSVLLTLQFEDIVRFFKTMRTADDEVDTLKVGRLVVVRSSACAIPPDVACRLQASDSDGDGMDESPSVRAEGATGDVCGGEEGVVGADVDPSSSMLGAYLGRFRDLSQDIPQGFLTWWEELQRVGMGGPQRRPASELYSIATASGRVVRIGGPPPADPL